MSSPELNIRSLQRQLVSYTKQKMTPASKRSRNPAAEIHATASTFDDKGRRKVIIFHLMECKTYEHGQALTYKATCPQCGKRNAISVQTAYKGSNAIWPPHDGYPDRCDRCLGGAS